MIDLHFPVLGFFLPTDRAYRLYSALMELIASLHHASGKMAACSRLRPEILSGLWVGLAEPLVDAA